jgi:hypothetical protein
MKRDGGKRGDDRDWNDGVRFQKELFVKLSPPA